MAHAGATLRQGAVVSPRKEKWGHLTTLDPSVFPRGLYSLDRLRFFPILPKKTVEGLGEQNREQGCETCCLGRVEGHAGLPGGLQEYYPRMSASEESELKVSRQVRANPPDVGPE